LIGHYQNQPLAVFCPDFEVFFAESLWPSFYINVATDIIIGDFANLVGNNLMEQSKG
jgi:hypothetical protein